MKYDHLCSQNADNSRKTKTASKQRIKVKWNYIGQLEENILYWFFVVVDLHRHRATRMYTSDGKRLSDGADVCDCLIHTCPGCHFPCPKCLSPKCGAECRNNRTWFYMEVENEGSRTRIINDILLKDHSVLQAVNGKLVPQQQQQQQHWKHCRTSYLS